MPELLITGASGLIGSKFVSDYSDSYTFNTLDVSDPIRPIDITNEDQVKQVFAESSAAAVLHLAAYTDVSGAWKQNGDRSGIAYQVNVVGTKNIVKACAQTGKQLLHISTAYVFDGEKSTPYSENDLLNPIEWYGLTKAEAESVVTESTIDWSIIRIDQPFRSDPFVRPDLIHKMAANLLQENPYPLFTNHYIGPTFIDDFVRVLDWFLRTKTTGIFHASSGEKWSDYDLGVLLKETFNLPGPVRPGDLAAYLQTLDRPYQKNTSLATDKLTARIDFEQLSIAEAIKKVDLGDLVKKTAVA